jgi:hypothetical protein
MSSSRGRQGQYLYGKAHRDARKRFLRRMERGEVFHCWRPGCGKRLDPRLPWDLGHVDPEFWPTYGRSHPECLKCNRSTLPRMLAKARGEAPTPKAPPPAHDCRKEFDPEHCAECRRSDPTPENRSTRMSRHWWPAGEYNPRCRDCRERGSACDVALKRMA